MANEKWRNFTEEQKDSLLDSLEGLYNENETVQEAVEKKWGYTDPGLAAKRVLRAENNELRQRLDDFEAKQREKEIRGRVNDDMRSAKEKYNLTDEDMKEVSKLMMEGGITSYDKASDYYRLSKQAAIPSTANFVDRTALTLPNEPELFKDRNGWAKREAYKALAEIERNRAVAA
jgi:regulator of replication initiation timing